MPIGMTLNLLPREDRFYALISESGELAYQSVCLMQVLVSESDPERRFKLGRDIQAAKSRAKAVTHEIAERLCKTFVTPFDREDIHAMSGRLYRIPKIAEKTQARILAFALKPLENDFYKFTDNMTEAAEQVHFLIQNLKSFKDSRVVQDRCALLDNIETRNDDMLDQLLVALNQIEPDAKQFVLRREIYNLMEDIVDCHRDVGDIVLGIVLKHT